MTTTDENPALLISDFKFGHVKIELRQEDITKCRVEAIVNPTNERLLFGGGLSARLLAKGGNAVFQASKDLIKTKGVLQTGTCVHSTGGTLPCRHLLHAVTPVWGDGNSGEDAALMATIQAIFSLAGSLKIESIALPLLSAGNRPYPKETVAKLMIQELIPHLENMKGSALRLVRLSTEDQDGLALLQEEFEMMKFTQQYAVQQEGGEEIIPDVGSWIKEQRMVPPKPKPAPPVKKPETPVVPVQRQQTVVPAPAPAVAPVVETKNVVLNLADKVPPIDLNARSPPPPQTAAVAEPTTAGLKKDKPRQPVSNKCCMIF